eukprot:c6188_g2_i1 orf=328-522(+)
MKCTSSFAVGNFRNQRQWMQQETSIPQSIAEAYTKMELKWFENLFTSGKLQRSDPEKQILANKV